MSLKPTMQLILWFIIWTLLVLISAPLIAAESDNKRISKTISFSSSDNIDITARDKKLQQAILEENSEIVKNGLRVESSIINSQLVSSSHVTTVDAYIHDVSTEMISDFNHDGFYHRFSLTIDADTPYDSADIYAEIYLSYEGGPWNYYASSNEYRIYGDSDADSFIIETELLDGFPTGYYDIRIELYDAISDIRLDVYSAYDDLSLLELPLEDSYYDESYYLAPSPTSTEVIVSGHGHGAFSWWLILFTGVLIVSRRLIRKP